MVNNDTLRHLEKLILRLNIVTIEMFKNSVKFIFKLLKSSNFVSFEFLNTNTPNLDRFVFWNFRNSIKLEFLINSLGRSLF